MSTPVDMSVRDKTEVGLLQSFDPLFLTIGDWRCCCGHVETAATPHPKYRLRFAFCRQCGQSALIAVDPDELEEQS